MNVSQRVTLCYMARETMTVRIDPQTRKALDAIAAARDRDRTYIVNEALGAYLEIYHWQVQHIRQGLREAEAGRFAAEGEVRKTIARLTRR